MKPITLVLLPGLDGTGLLSQQFVAALPANIRPIIVSFPGDRHLSYQGLQSLVMDALPRDEPFILLGESFSGPLAVMVSATHPKGLVGLILCATFVTAPRPMIARLLSFAARSMLFRLYMPYKRLKARAGGYGDRRQFDLLAEIERLVLPAVIASRVRMVCRVDVREDLRACQVPMMYLQGSKDRIVPSGNLRIIQRTRPNIEVAEVGTSHSVLERQPGHAAEVISNFASSLTTRNARSAD